MNKMHYYLVDQTWLGVRSHSEGEFKLLFSYKAGILRGQNQPVDQLTATALLKYGQKST